MYRYAEVSELVRTRIIVLRAANKLSDDEDMSVVEEESKAYYRRVLETGEHIAGRDIAGTDAGSRRTITEK